MYTDSHKNFSFFAKWKRWWWCGDYYYTDFLLSQKSTTFTHCCVLFVKPIISSSFLFFLLITSIDGLLSQACQHVTFEMNDAEHDTTTEPILRHQSFVVLSVIANSWNPLTCFVTLWFTEGIGLFSKLPSLLNSPVNWLESVVKGPD